MSSGIPNGLPWYGSGTVFSSRIPIRFADEDHARIVYFPRFFHFFHCAFEDFFNEQGMPYRACLDEDLVGWPAVHAEADFIRPVRFGETLRVDVSLERIGHKSATWVYRGHHDGIDAPAVVGKIVTACMHMETYEGVPIPDKYRALLEKHLEAPSDD